MCYLEENYLNGYENGDSERVPTTPLRDNVELLNINCADKKSIHLVFEYLDMDLKQFLDIHLKV